MTDILDAEVIEPGMELDARPEPGTLFRTEDPAEFLAKATTTADALAKVVRKQKLFVKISGKDHVKVEGWTMLGSLLGVFPICVWTRPLEGGWEARVEARTITGQMIGSAEAECLRSETLWANRDDYALRSMAQTRATSKALRQPLGFVMTLAGFDATPLEEMPPSEAEPPFEQTGPQGPEGGTDGEHDAPGTGASPTREEALEQRRLELTAQLRELALKVGKATVTDTKVGKNREANKDAPAKHLVWLEQQVEAAKAAVALQEQIEI